jgi:nitrite reductase (cytochrome c-552)
LQHTAGLNVAKAHEIIAKAGNIPNANQAQLTNARELLRQAQWYWDYVAASNSMGFHNSVQELHTLGQSIDLSHRAIDAAKQAVGANQL